MPRIVSLTNVRLEVEQKTGHLCCERATKKPPLWGQDVLYGFRLNLVVSDSIRLAKLRSRADASRKKYGFCDMDAQAALSRLCRN